MASNLNTSNCSACTRRYPMRKPDENCKTVEEQICDIRLVCQDEITEVVSPSEDLLCEKGYLSDVIPTPGAVAEPMVAIDVLNPEDIDETLEYAFDRDSDVGTETYALTPLKIKIYNPDQECAFDSWKGQDICIYYRINNRDGDYGWRRFCGKLSNVTGSLLAGYELTIDIVDPDDSTRPCFVNLGGTATTTAALDLITTFG